MLYLPVLSAPALPGQSGGSASPSWRAGYRRAARRLRIRWKRCARSKRRQSRAQPIHLSLPSAAGLRGR